MLMTVHKSAAKRNSHRAGSRYMNVARIGANMMWLRASIIIATVHHCSQRACGKNECLQRSNRDTSLKRT